MDKTSNLKEEADEARSSAGTRDGAVKVGKAVLWGSKSAPR